MKKLIVSIGCTVAFLAASNVAVAQGKGGGTPKPKVSTGPAKSGSMAHGGGKTTHVSTTTTGPRVTAQGGTKAHGPTLKATGGSQSAAKAGGPKAKSTTTAKAGGPKTNTTTTAKATGPKNKSTTTTAKETGPKTKSTTTTTTASTSTGKSKKEATTVTTGETLTAVQQKLQRNTNLAKKLESRLPKGTDLMEAASDFRNLGQFVAAVNASYNHDLDFDKLKTAMVDDGMSLGQAMKDQRSSLDDGAEAIRIQREADVMIRSTEPELTTSTTSTRKPATAKAKDSRQ